MFACLCKASEKELDYAPSVTTEKAITWTIDWFKTVGYVDKTAWNLVFTEGGLFTQKILRQVAPQGVIMIQPAVSVREFDDKIVGFYRIIMQFVGI